MDTRETGAEHPFPEMVSAMEVKTRDNEVVFLDPKRAHEAVGDPDWSRFIPETCNSCRAAQLKNEAIKKVRPEGSLDG